MTGLGAAFDSTELRRAVAHQWALEGYEAKVAAKWKAWEESPEGGTNVLEGLGWKAVAEIKTSLNAKAWEDTLKLVTFDIPTTAVQARDLTTKFIGRTENDGARAAIFKIVPKMKDQADTEEFMQKMILPFRSFVVGQVVTLLMDQVESGIEPMLGEGATSAVVSKANSSNMKATNSAAPTAGGGGAEGAKQDTAKAKKKSRLSKEPTQPAMTHAAQHAKDIADVVFINTLVPESDKELKQHITRLQKKGICTRYAQYCYLYMTLEEAASDAELVAKLLPLANSGLAQAQYDVGLYALNNTEAGSGKIGSGEEWLLRAARLGHSKAMLSLVKLYLVKARNCLASKNMRRSDAQQGYKTARLGALKWYDVLQDTKWDEETEDDETQAKKLSQELKMLDGLAPFDVDGKKKKFGGVYSNWGKVLIGFFVVVVAFVITTVPSGSGDQGNDDQPTHNSKTHRKSKWH